MLCERTGEEASCSDELAAETLSDRHFDRLLKISDFQTDPRLRFFQAHLGVGFFRI